MSVQSEITRITTAKSAIATAITGKGVTVPSGTKIDGMAALIDTITTGGELESITITTPPTKTSYIAGEDFDPTGMEVTAVVSGVSIPVTGYTVTPSTLTAGVTSVTVSFTVNGVTKSAVQEVTVIAYASFGESTWTQIAQAAKEGVAAQVWNVGDIKKETINGTEYEIVIYGFDHYDLATADSSYNNGSGKAAILLGLKNCFNMKMNFDDGSAPWGSSLLRSDLSGYYFKPNLPTELKNALRSVKIKYLSMSGSSTNTSNDEIFVPSVYEIFGKTMSYATQYIQYEGNQYQYYKAGNSAKKDYSYWTRSVCQMGSGDSFGYMSSAAVIVQSNGTSTTYSAKTDTQYCSPCFCI